MLNDPSGNVPSTREQAISPHGERPLPPLTRYMDLLGGRLLESGALGLMLIDATPLMQIERLYGARPFRLALASLAQRVKARVTRDVDPKFLMTSGALEEEHILVFFDRRRTDCLFYTEVLPRLAESLRLYIAESLKKIVYPYLHSPGVIPVGQGLALYRPFHRPSMQIRKLAEATLRAAHFERERSERQYARTLEAILFDEAITSVYEPIMHIADRQVIGYEALSRGPMGSGLESPATLFAIADRCDLTYELDALCRRKALQGVHDIGPGHKLFLNILPTGIYHPDFENVRIQEMLGGVGLSPRDLVLEISEREAISNFHIFKEAIDRFAKLGFSIALDDVGAGYSSLEAAMEIHPDFLKIDMSLVRGIDGDPQRQDLLRSLQSLAERMNATVIAEGIETDDELEAVHAVGIACGQGYRIGRGGPLPPATPPEETEDVDAVFGEPGDFCEPGEPDGEP